MSIRTRLLLGYFGVIVILMASGTLIIDTMSGELEDAVRRDARALASALRDRVGQAVYARIQSMRAFAGTSLALQDGLAESNEEFEKLGTEEEIRASIIAEDAAWDRANPTPAMKRRMNVGTSAVLQRTRAYYARDEGYPVFAEIFVTNRYGANAGQTGPTEDFRQDDEPWWDHAWKTGVWVADEIEQDVSAGVLALDIGVRVDDDHGKPLGVLKAVLDIRDLRDMIDGFDPGPGRAGAFLELLDGHGRVIHRQGEGDAVFGQDLSQQEAVRRAMDGGVGTVIEDTGRGEVLRAFAPHGEDPVPLKWTLVLNQPTAVVFADADRLRQWMLWVGIVSSLAAVLLGVFLSQSFGRVTQRLAQTSRALEQNEARLRSVVDGAVDGIVTIRPDGTIESVNPAVGRAFGYADDDMIGQNVRMLMPEPHLDRHDDYLQRYLQSGEARILGTVQSLRGRRRDGSTFPLDLSISEVHQGDLRLFVGILRDVTERHEAHRALEAAKDAAESASRSKGQFLANMSHELRTPLNAIIGYTEMVGEELEERGEAALVADLEKVRTAGRHLLGLINDILDVSKIEAGRMEVYVEQVQLGEFLRDVLHTIQPLMDQNGNELVLDAPDDVGAVRTDATKLRQILLNLLSNAAKFTHDGRVTLRARRSQEGGREWLTLRVTDTGIGMTPEQLDHVWEAFAQADVSTTRQFGGTGLGLTISRSFCEMLGGSIDVNSRAGQGTEFTLRLPVVTTPVTAPAGGESGRAQAGGQPAALDTILVIDDDPAVRDLVRRFLRRQGMDVVSAASGREGLRLAAEVLPSVIVLDVMMPGMDGWAVLDALKRDEQLAHIPVVMLTMVDERRLGFALGVDAYVTKPVDRSTLTGALAPFRLDPGSHSVLVVEDDDDARALITRRLRKLGWQVVEAGDGKEALELLDDGIKPDIILTDLMMPRVDGFELVDSLQRDDRFRGIPVVVLTSKDITAEDAARLEGAIEHLMQKGAYDRDALMAEIGRLVRAAVLRRRAL